MTLYIYNFDKNNILQNSVSFNGNLYDVDALTYRLVLKSRYNNKELVSQTNANSWLIELELDTYNDRFTEFTIPSLQQDLVGEQFTSGYYDYSIEWTNSNVTQADNPDDYTWNVVQDGLLKLKTSTTDDLAFEGPDSDYLPTKHYEGPNPTAESYVIYKQ